MAISKSYGSITLVDITDIGEFSVYPVGNMPLTVIYSPDQNTYVPNWTTTNLTLTPIVYYAGKQIDVANTSTATVTWKRKDGTATEHDVNDSGETVGNDGVLSVTENQFTPESSMITYIVEATYVEPNSGQTLTAQGQMTFAMLKQYSALKNCVITGGSIFKYNTDGSLVGTSSIILSGDVANVDIVRWEYKNASGNWVTYPNSNNSGTLTIYATDEVFTNDTVSIRLVTSDENVYDIHTVTKLRDGAAGSSTYTSVLTNEDQLIPFDEHGVGDFSLATSRIIIYKGGVDDTANWTITQSYTNVTATPSKTTKTNDTTSITAMNGNSGSVTFTCTKSDSASIIKNFSVVKVESIAGISPTVYTLEPETYTLNKSINNVFTPSTVKFNAFQKTGNDNKVSYTGRFKIYENVEYGNIATATAKYTSSVNQSSYTYTPSSSATRILCVLYKDGGTSDVLDYQTVVVTNDGATGEQGESALNVILGNESDVIPVTESNTVSGNITITIPFSGYKGTTKVATTLSNTVTLFGASPTVTQATASTDGRIVWSGLSGKSVSGTSGTVSLVFTCEGKSITKEYRWTASKDATNAVMFQLYAPSGNVFSDDVTTLTLQGQVTNGTTDVTENATNWKWSKYSVSTQRYVSITGSSSSLSVNRDSVDSYSSYKCECTYNGKNYIAYHSLLDKTDPIQVIALSSLGTQIVNGQGFGALYCKVTRNGVEIDNIKSEVFSTTAPLHPSLNDYYYHITKKTSSASGSVVLKKYNGSAWVTEEESYKGTYTWTFRDSDGNALDTTATGKVVYIDGSFINKKIVCDVEVTI